MHKKLSSNLKTIHGWNDHLKNTVSDIFFAFIFFWHKSDKLQTFVLVDWSTGLRLSERHIDIFLVDWVQVRNFDL